MCLHARGQPARATDADGIWWCDKARGPNSSAHVRSVPSSPEVVKRCSPHRAFCVLWRNLPPILQACASSCDVIEFLEASAGVQTPRTPPACARTHARGRARQHRHVRFSGFGELTHAATRGSGGRDVMQKSSLPCFENKQHSHARVHERIFKRLLTQFRSQDPLWREKWNWSVDGEQPSTPLRGHSRRPPSQKDGHGTSGSASHTCAHAHTRTCTYAAAHPHVSCVFHLK